MKRQYLKLRPYEFSLFIAVCLSLALLPSCANGVVPASTATTSASLDGAGNVPPPPSSGSNGTVVTSATSAPLQFQVTGMGNHPEFVCIPAKTKLWLKVVPNQNSTALFPYGYLDWTYSNNTFIYQGSPAFYSQLRVRLTIPGTAANYDFLANVNNPSVEGDYSAYLSGTPSQIVNQASSTATLPVPEYTDEWIFGSTPYDGKCTYWEQYFGKCSAISASLLSANTATCQSGQVKILVNSVVSDYPCNNSTVTSELNWCAGSQLQLVADYQQWSLTIFAATENTSTTGF